MRILELHTEQFGGLSGFTLRPARGTTGICRGNGWGKSTLAAFLLVMFYGFENERVRDPYRNERQRYRPWQGGVYGGRVIFETKTGCYELSRTFGLKEKEDTFDLRDHSTGLPAELEGAPNLGPALFGLDRDSFARTAFFGQGECETEPTDGIHARLGQSGVIRGDMDSCEAALSALSRAAAELNPKRKTGRLYRQRMELHELDARLLSASAAEDRIRNLEQQTEELDSDIRVLERRSEALDQRLRQCIGTQGRTEEQSRRAEELKRRRERLSAEYERVRTAFSAQTLPEEEKLDELCAQCARIGERDEHRPIPMWTLLLPVAAAVVMVLLKPNPVGMAAALGFLMAGIVLIAALRRGAAKEHREGTRAEEAVLAQLEELGVEPEEDLPAQCEELRRNLRSCLRLRRKLAENREELNGTLTRMRQETDGGDGINAAEVERRLTELKKRTAQNRRSREALQRELRQAEEEREDLARAAQRREALKGTMEEEEQRLRRIELTRRLLEQAKTAYTGQYAGPVEAAFGRYFTMLTGREPEGFRMDDRLNLTVTAGGQPRETEFLSAGWRQLLGICMRLALVDVMFGSEGQEKPLLILDDPLTDLDGEKTEQAQLFLRQAGERYQILYFTCHESRRL